MKIHSDHLGSASFVTDRGGNVMQHLQYLPYGELFVSQRNSEEFDSSYKFTAKELDNETSYTYFGARYYDADISSWLSVDPLSDKYPSLSPYCYSANNPVVLVDPNGMDWYDFTDENVLGVYMGNEIMEENGERKAIGYQYVNPKGLGKMDENTHSYIGESMLHEVAEAFIGCEIALNRNTGSPPANEPGSTYKDAHKRANLISCGEYHKVPIIDGANIPKIKKNINSYYFDKDTIIYEKRCD